MGARGADFTDRLISSICCDAHFQAEATRGLDIVDENATHGQKITIGVVAPELPLVIYASVRLNFAGGGHSIGRSTHVLIKRRQRGSRDFFVLRRKRARNPNSAGALTFEHVRHAPLTGVRFARWRPTRHCINHLSGHAYGRRCARLAHRKVDGIGPRAIHALGVQQRTGVIDDRDRHWATQLEGGALSARQHQVCVGEGECMFGMHFGLQRAKRATRG
jgi:hypothetical protein